MTTNGMVKVGRGRIFLKTLKTPCPFLRKPRAKWPAEIFSSERKGPIPTFHKAVKEVGIVPISIFPNLKIGTLGDGWSRTNTEKFFSRPPCLMAARAREGRKRKNH